MTTVILVKHWYKYYAEERNVKYKIFVISKAAYDSCQTLSAAAPATASLTLTRPADAHSLLLSSSLTQIWSTQSQQQDGYRIAFAWYSLYKAHHFIDYLFKMFSLNSKMWVCFQVCTQVSSILKTTLWEVSTFGIIEKFLK